MANVQNILKAAKKQKTAQPRTDAPRQTVTEQRVVSNNVNELENLYSSTADGRIQGLDYTLYPNGTERKVYDANEEMKEISEGFDYSKVTSKMPSAILQSVLSNPLDMPIPSEVEDQLMNEELKNRTVDIIGKLESRDRGDQPKQHSQQILTEVSDRNIESGESLDKIISRIIDEKFSRLEKKLSNIGSVPGLRMIKLNENSTMMFMDEDNNVYECKLVYKGKGKVRK